MRPSAKIRLFFAFLFCLAALSVTCVSAAGPEVGIDISGPSPSGKLTVSVSVTNPGQTPVTGVSASAEIDLGKDGKKTFEVSLPSVIAPGKTVSAGFTVRNGIPAAPFIAGGAALLIAAGVLCFVLLRRRRVRAASVLSAVLVAALLIPGLPPASAADAQPAEGPPPSELTLEIAGAEFRPDADVRGGRIRFVAVLKDESVKELKANAEFESCSVRVDLKYSSLDCGIEKTGMRILPSSAVKKDGDLMYGPAAGVYGAEALPSGYGDEGWIGTVDPSAVPGYVFCGEFPGGVSVAGFKLPFSAAAYATVSDNGLKRELVTDVFHTSLYETAEKAQSDPDAGKAAAVLKAQITDRYAERRARPVFASDEEIAELRSAIVAKMDEMADVEWTAGGTVDTKGQTSYTTPAYKRGSKYYGMIYNNSRSSLEAFSSVLRENGLLTSDYILDINTFWNTTPGVSCSTSIIGAYTYFINTVDKVIGAAMMLPTAGNGFVKAGNYNIPSGAKTSDEILAANTKQTMAAAYAELKKGDVLISLWKNKSGTLLSHSIMAYDDPEVVLNADGTVNGSASRLRTIEQTSSLSVYKDGLTSWRRKTVSFDQLYVGTDSLRFIPVKYAKLESGINAPCWCVLRNPNPGRILKEGLRGTVESGYVVKNLTATVTGEDGQTVFRGVYSHEYVKTLNLAALRDLNSGLKSVPQGTYRITVSANCRNGEYLLLDVTETK